MVRIAAQQMEVLLVFTVFDKLRSYDNATWMQLTCHRNVIFCSGRLSDVSAVKIKM